MLDKYKELRQKGLVDEGKVTISISGEGINEIASMTYPKFDQDNGSALPQIAESMTRLEIEYSINQIRDRLEAFEELYEEAFGVKPPKP